MQFFKSILVCSTALLAFALAQDQLKITKAPSSVQGGQSYTIEWTGGDGSPATILLREGASNDLKTVATLTTSATGGKFTWNVDNSLVTDNDYAIQITEGTETNYWAVSVAADGTASASSSTASSTASSSKSSTASSSTATSASHTSSSVSASITSTRNSTTISSATLKSSKTSSGSSTDSTASSTSTSSSSSSSAAAAAPSSGSNNLKSNAALVLGAVAAIAYLG